MQQSAQSHPRRYVSDAWLASYFGVNRATIWRWVKAGNLPQPVKLSGGTTRWDLTKIEAQETA